MNKSDNELYQLCQTIVSCGELTEDTIRQLSEYLNSSPNASTSWPGNLLIKPLQKVWKDGIIDESELESLSALLNSIVQAVPEKKPSIERKIPKKKSVKKTEALSARNWIWILLAIIAFIISQFTGCGRRRRRGSFFRSRRRR